MGSRYRLDIFAREIAFGGARTTLIELGPAKSEDNTIGTKLRVKYEIS